MSKYLLFFSSFKCLHYGNTYNIIPKIPHILISPIKYIREFQTGIIIDYYMTFFILHINSRHQYSGADGAPSARPPKIGKNMIFFGVKS